MKKIIVQYNYEVNKSIEIDVDDLVSIDGNSVDEIAKKYVLSDTNNFFIDDISDVNLFIHSDTDFINFEVVDTIDDDCEVDELTFEDLQLLNSSNKYNL